MRGKEGGLGCQVSRRRSLRVMERMGGGGRFLCDWTLRMARVEQEREEEGWSDPRRRAIRRRSDRRRHFRRPPLPLLLPLLPAIRWASIRLRLLPSNQRSLSTRMAARLRNPTTRRRRLSSPSRLAKSVQRRTTTPPLRAAPVGARARLAQGRGARVLVTTRRIMRRTRRRRERLDRREGEGGGRTRRMCRRLSGEICRRRDLWVPQSSVWRCVERD